MSNCYRLDPAKLAFIHANTTPGMRPDFERLGRLANKEGFTKTPAAEFSLTLRNVWHRAEKAKLRKKPK